LKNGTTRWIAVEAQTLFENSQPIPILPLHYAEVVRQSGVGREFWRLAKFVERIYVYLILWRLTVGTGDRTVYEIVDIIHLQRTLCSFGVALCVQIVHHES